MSFPFPIFKMILPLLLFLPSSTVARPKFDMLIGNFIGLKQGVSGIVYANNKSSIVIDNFHYNGKGPDVFFMMSTRGTPANIKTRTNKNPENILDLSSPEVAVLVPDGGAFKYDDDTVTTLGPYTGQMVTLNLPKDVEVSDVAFISLFCRLFRVNFGHIVFPQSCDWCDKKEESSDGGTDEHEHEVESERKEETSDEENSDSEKSVEHAEI